MIKIMYLSVLLLILPSASMAEAKKFPGRLAVVDMQKVLTDSEFGKSAKKQLEKSLNPEKEKLEGYRNEIMQLKVDLQKKAALLSEEALEKKAAAIQEKERNAVRAVQDFKERMTVENRSLVQKAIEEVDVIIKELAEEQGYDFVLEKNQPGFLYSSNQIDITETVIKLLNKKRVK